MPLTLSFLIQLQRRERNFRKKLNYHSGQALTCLICPFWIPNWWRKVREQSKSPYGHPGWAGLFPVALLRCRANWQTAATPSTSSTVCCPDGGEMWTELCWFESVNLIPEHIGDCPTAMPMCASIKAAIQPKTLMNVQSKKQFS